MLATARAECRAQVNSPDVCTHVRQTPHLWTHPVPTSFRLPQTAAHMNEPRRKTASEISMSPLRIHACKCTPFFRQKERNAEQKYQQIIHLTLFPAPRSASPGKTGEKSALRHILQRSHRPMARGRKQKKESWRLSFLLADNRAGPLSCFYGFVLAPHIVGRPHRGMAGPLMRGIAAFT